MQEPFALDTLTAADIHTCWQLSQALRWPHRQADRQQAPALASGAQGGRIGGDEGRTGTGHGSGRTGGWRRRREEVAGAASGSFV